MNVKLYRKCPSCKGKKTTIMVTSLKCSECGYEEYLDDELEI